MKPLLLLTLLAATVLAEEPVSREWTDNQGRKLVATFRGFEEGKVFLQTADGRVFRFELGKLSPEDQKVAMALKPAGLGIPQSSDIAQAAAKIDFLVDSGLKHRDQKPNPLASDEQFVRRVYLDIVGRIPTREEALALITDTSPSKRAKLIDKLLADDGANSHLFNYFADMLRIADTANKGRFYSYEEWFKAQLAANKPWDKIVYEMMTAEGKLLDNGATGYLLRDPGMRLDNLSLTLTTFLGANVACAQCHNHPFAEWTQKQFYQMAAFFGATDAVGARGGKSPEMREMRAALAKLDDTRLRQQAGNMLRITQFRAETLEKNEVKLPDDYKYKDGKPGDEVKPQLVTWSKDDTRRDAYRDVKTKDPENLRREFAEWMTAPDNPRFAMTIANRLWQRAFGVGVKEPVTDLDEPETAFNPPLLHHLTSEMVRLKFDLKGFMRLVFNTQAYQREAMHYDFEAGTPYMFAGPALRRMTGEQAWDSCAILAVGTNSEQFKNERAEKYATAMNIDFKASNLEQQLRNAMASMRTVGSFTGGKGKGGKAKKAKRMMQEEMAGDGESEDFSTEPPRLGGLVLARASELRQPEADQHFLRQFGQSDRQLCDAASDEGNVPQVLMLMNGEAQAVIASRRSLVVKTAAEQSSPEAQIESLYASFFCRKPKPEEISTAKAALAEGMGLEDLAWVLFNTREFMFVE